MFFFSKLKGLRVNNDQDQTIGKIDDAFFVSNGTAIITALSISKRHGAAERIPITAIKPGEACWQVAANYSPAAQPEHELSIMKNLMNKQIIDVKGNKVVRVNDVLLQEKKDGQLCVPGVDIGFRGILRWLKLDPIVQPLYRFTHLDTHPHILSWADIQPLELSRGTVHLKKELENLKKLHPGDLADYLEETNLHNIKKIISNLDNEFAADVIEDLNPNYQTALFRKLPIEKAVPLIDSIDPDDAVDILLTLPADQQELILSRVSEAKKAELKALINLSNTPIGELIDPDVITIAPNATVKIALETVKDRLTDSSFSAYIYVVNLREELVGVVHISQLLVQPPETLIKTIMQPDVVVLHLTTDKSLAIKKLLKYKIHALPVVDHEDRLLGIVTFDDMVGEILKKL